MPLTYDPNKTIEENVEIAQKRLKNGEIDRQKYDEEVKDLYAFVFGVRSGGHIGRNSSDIKRIKVVQQNFDPEYRFLKGSATFGEFVKKNVNSKNDIRKGHGGAAEDEFKSYVNERDRLPADVPVRYMPSCKDRVEKLQGDLKDKDAKSAEAIRIYSEIFRSRRAVGARHDVKEAKGNVNFLITGENYVRTPDLEKNATFRKFVEEKGDELKKKMASGHGGEAEHMFRDYVNELEHIPEDVPQAYMPSAEMRIEHLQKKIKSDGFDSLSPEKQQETYIELLAARSCVGAERGKGQTLDRYMDPKNNRAWVNYWSHSETLKKFFADNPNMLKKAAKKGHGGEIEDELKEYIKKQDIIPDDIPPQYMPNGKERLESVQEKIGSASFTSLPEDKQLESYAKLMAARETVGAVKGDKASLEKPLDTKQFKTSIRDWTSNKTFRDFIKNDPEAARKAALNGHGGELGEKFKEYVKNLDHIPADIPAPFLPDAKERTEILQNKIKSTADAAKRNNLYRELMATRASVESVRGDKDSLERKIDAGKLNEAYGKLNKSVSCRNFLNKTPADKLYEAAREGHGGALDDAYTNYAAERTWRIGTVPSGVPERFRPGPDDVINKYRTEMSAECKNKPDSWYAENSDRIMKKAAEMLYLTQVNSKMPTKAEKTGMMSHDVMQDGVQNILEDGKFRNMFRNLGPKETAKLVSGKSAAPLIEAYRNAPEPAPAGHDAPQNRPQPVLQGLRNDQPQNQQPQPNQQNPQHQGPGLQA